VVVIAGGLVSIGGAFFGLRHRQAEMQARDAEMAARAAAAEARMQAEVARQKAEQAQKQALEGRAGTAATPPSTTQKPTTARRLSP
jgi:hypothetical protein